MSANRHDDADAGSAIVILPARGGSKRFPRKNIAPLAGRPLIAFPIAAARQAQLVDAVYVSTDDDEIAAISEQWGGSVPFRRPAEFAGDHVPADEAVADMVRRLEADHGQKIGIVVMIQPTSPFVTPAHIDAAIGRLRTEPELESVTTMAELDHRHHPYNLAYPGPNGTWEFIHAKERSEARIRQAKPVALKFGNLFAARSSTFLTVGRFGKVKGSVIIDPIYSWDVDHPDDLHAAEALLTGGFVDLPHVKDWQ